MVANLGRTVKLNNRISRDFFLDETVEVAKNLLYCILRRRSRGDFLIVETEAYLQNDPASHSFRGKTKRNQHMFLLGGHSYVYLIYGLHHCFNVVTGKEGVGEAVLIRSVLDLANNRLIKGPGNVCKELEINLSHSGVDLLENPFISLEVAAVQVKITNTTRVGISKGTDLKYRFLNTEFLKI